VPDRWQRSNSTSYNTGSDGSSAMASAGLQKHTSGIYVVVEKNEVQLRQMAPSQESSPSYVVMNKKISHSQYT
jgi:hypothetical protein